MTRRIALLFAAVVLGSLLAAPVASAKTQSNSCYGSHGHSDNCGFATYPEGNSQGNSYHYHSNHN